MTQTKEETYTCRKCETVYFEEQECDWCPGIIVKKDEENGTDKI